MEKCKNCRAMVAVVVIGLSVVTIGAMLARHVTRSFGVVSVTIGGVAGTADGGGLRLVVRQMPGGNVGSCAIASEVIECAPDSKCGLSANDLSQIKLGRDVEVSVLCMYTPDLVGSRCVTSCVALTAK